MIYLWRGLFDTDGSVISQGAVNFCSINKNIIKECYNFLNKQKIEGKINKRGDQIIVEAKDLDLFKNIGLSHPRKQKEFLNLIGKDCFYHKALTNDKFLKMIRLDKEGYRVRLCKKEFRRQGLNEKQVINIFKNRYGLLPKQVGKLTYVKSKKLFNLFTNKIDFSRLWTTIDYQERLKLQNEWNKVWN